MEQEPDVSAATSGGSLSLFGDRTEGASANKCVSSTLLKYTPDMQFLPHQHSVKEYVSYI